MSGWLGRAYLRDMKCTVLIWTLWVRTPIRSNLEWLQFRLCNSDLQIMYNPGEAQPATPNNQRKCQK